MLYLSMFVIINNFSVETTKDLRNRQNSLSKNMRKATGSLLQGDTLLIKSLIGNASKTPDENAPNVVAEHTSNDLSLRDKVNEQVRLKSKDKDFKNASNSDEMARKNDQKMMEREEDNVERDTDDKTPTNEISMSSMNDMTDNSILKDSMESEKNTLLFTDDIKNDLMADDEKDDDHSERTKFVNAWVARLACKEKGICFVLTFNLLFS